MSSRVKSFAIAFTTLALVTAPAWAQTSKTPPPASTTGVEGPRLTPASSSEGSPAAALPAPGMVEGSVRSVDPAARTIDIASGWPGFLFSKTLEVGPDTQITMGGKAAALAEIREGAKVRAAYEARAGKMVATRIEVLPG